jgi:BirA family biotin operon repressor/biotin-[acetyl-CoA-carboxylase] ligase
MHEQEVLAALADLPLGGLRFFRTIGSTNDEALAWAATGASDLAIVVADEQTEGRGRGGRKWHTPPGSALAVSIVLRPTHIERTFPARLTGLAALALVDFCSDLGLQAQIKWPNDILLRGCKTAGVLVESAWAGNQLDAAVVGIGLNVTAVAVPPPDQVSFPATCLETELHASIDRLKVLNGILAALLGWRRRIGEREFMRSWEAALAFRGAQVSVSKDDEPPLHGTLLGLEPDGGLRLFAGGRPVVVHFGEIHLRPMDDKIQ